MIFRQVAAEREREIKCKCSVKKQGNFFWLCIFGYRLEMDTGVIVGWDLPIIHAMGMEATQAAFLYTVLLDVLVVVPNEAKVAGLQKEMLLLCNKQRSSWLL